MHDPRVGRFLSLDPLAKTYPYNSPYAFSENDVIRATELEGTEKNIVIGSMDNEGKIHFAHITDKELIKLLWNTYATDKEAKWGKGEWRYKYYTNPQESKNQYPEFLNGTGTLIVTEIDGKRKLQFVDWENDHKEKLASIQKQRNRIGADTFETSGDAIASAGLVGSPFTGGVSLVIVPIGEGMATIGLIANSALDISEGEYGQLAMRLGIEAISFGTGSLIKKIDKPIIDELNKSMKKIDWNDIKGSVGRILDDLEKTETISKPILQSLEKGLNEGLNQMREKIKEDDNKNNKKKS